MAPERSWRWRQARHLVKLSAEDVGFQGADEEADDDEDEEGGDNFGFFDEAEEEQGAPAASAAAAPEEEEEEEEDDGDEFLDDMDILNELAGVGEAPPPTEAERAPGASLQ